MELTYAQYLQLDKILDAQKPLAPEEHDEMLFITIHQSYELWFQQVLFEMKALAAHLTGNNAEPIRQDLRRILVIMKTLVAQVDVLETMTPLSFASFRDRLATASGFQSHQFRLLECALGHKDTARRWKGDPAAEHAIAAALAAPTLYDGLLSFIDRNSPYGFPAHVLDRDVSATYSPNGEVEDTFEKLYRDHHPLGQICELYVDLDEGIQEWRYRHVKMVERTIGRKVGTGGSTGASYLMTTLFRPTFPELWSVRTRF